MTKITKMDKYGEFVDECKFFPCKSGSMYGPEWSGDARFIIISNTPEAELLERYSEIMAFLSPYILLDKECGNPILESVTNTKKYHYRQQLESVQIDENTTGKAIGFVATDDDMIQKLMLEEALSNCTTHQRRRIMRYYLERISMRELAESETVSESAISMSISSGMKILREYYFTSI